MEALRADEALIIESRFSSRREIADGLQTPELGLKVIEAQSVSDGLAMLSSREIGACFLGPSLSVSAALRVLREGPETSRSPSCAYIVVRSREDSGSTDLIQAGAHAAIERPFQRRSFTEVVSKAIAIARARAGAEKHSNAHLSFALENAAAQLRSVAEGLVSGQLKVSSTGIPSLAARDALRVALERSLLTKEALEPGTFDHHFITCLVDWFVDRINSPCPKATETLRRKLMAYHSRAKLHSTG